GAEAQIRADALTLGNGGRVIVWSDDVTRFLGSLSARGGSSGGNGGFAEVSGGGTLVFDGNADLRARDALGLAGHLLLDPKNIIVSISDPGSATSRTSASDLDNFADNPAETSWITPANLVTLLNAANVTLEANNDMSFRDPVTATS